MRLWIGGDSLAGSLGPSLGKLEGDTGVVKPVFNSRVSSGLASPNFYNWPKHAASDMALYKPETAVFIIGANDTELYSRRGQMRGSPTIERRSTRCWTFSAAEGFATSYGLALHDSRTHQWIAALS